MNELREGLLRTLRRLLSKPCVPDRRDKVAAIVERLASLGKEVWCSG